MNSTLHLPCSRALAAGALSVALLSGGTAGAFAASPDAATPKPTRTSSANAAPASASITVKANKTQVKAGDSVTFSGRTKGLKVGSKVVLEHKSNGKWNALKAGTTVKNGSSYSLTAKINTKGKEQLRVTDGKTVSPTVTVAVK